MGKFESEIASKFSVGRWSAFRSDVECHRLAMAFDWLFNSHHCRLRSNIRISGTNEPCGHFVCTANGLRRHRTAQGACNAVAVSLWWTPSPARHRRGMSAPCRGWGGNGWGLPWECPAATAHWTSHRCSSISSRLPSSVGRERMEFHSRASTEHTIHRLDLKLHFIPFIEKEFPLCRVRLPVWRIGSTLRYAHSFGEVKQQVLAKKQALCTSGSPKAHRHSWKSNLLLFWSKEFRLKLLPEDATGSGGGGGTDGMLWINIFCSKPGWDD